VTGLVTDRIVPRLAETARGAGKSGKLHRRTCQDCLRLSRHSRVTCFLWRGCWTSSRRTSTRCARNWRCGVTKRSSTSLDCRLKRGQTRAACIAESATCLSSCPSVLHIRSFLAMPHSESCSVVTLRWSCSCCSLRFVDFNG